MNSKLTTHDTPHTIPVFGSSASKTGFGSFSGSSSVFGSSSGTAGAGVSFGTFASSTAGGGDFASMLSTKSAKGKAKEEEKEEEEGGEVPEKEFEAEDYQPKINLTQQERWSPRLLCLPPGLT